jgi:23S rRNA (uridine2552-2'-O)-methyltransferase
MPKSKSSRRWLDRHVNDEYVHRAQKDGYRSRATYKLLELQEKDQLIQPGQLVVDLGAAPGGWSQLARRLVGHRGRVVALDILPMNGIEGVEFIQGDFREQGPLQRLQNLLDGAQVDLVISDMAPNVTGQAAVDQPRAIYLCELALDFALKQLKPGGALAMKIFQGEGFDETVRQVKQHFERVLTRKPKASRSTSREVYLVARNLQV